MPWHLPEDLAHFRRVTMGCPVIMGRRTWDSLPARFQPLPGRRNVVVTRNPDWRADGADTRRLARRRARAAGRRRHRVRDRRRASSTRRRCRRADRLELTEIAIDVPDADTWFPAWDRSAYTPVAREDGRSAQGLEFDFVTYRRKDTDR